MVQLRFLYSCHLKLKMPVIWSLLLMLLLAVSTGCSAASTQNFTFWVAASEGECHGKQHCNTLARYQEDSTSVFSTSHATWVFLKGYHLMLPTPIVVSGAENVTWTGEKGCIPQECQIIQPSYNGTVNHSTHCSYIVFEDCRGISIRHLEFRSIEVTAQCPRHFYNIKLAGVEGAVLDSVTLAGGYSDGLGVFNASGRYKLVNSVNYNISMYSIGLNFCPSYSENCNFYLILTNLTFTGPRGVDFAVGEYANTEYSSISILVDNCNFTGYGRNQLAITALNYPPYSFTIIITNSAFEKSKDSVHLSMMLLVQNWSLVGQPQYRPLIHLNGLSVSSRTHGVNISLSYKFLDNKSCDVLYPEIMITNSSFFGSRKSHKKNLIHATLGPNNSVASYERCRALHSLPGFYPSTMIKFQDSKFYSNNNMSSVVYLEGFSWHRAAFHGGNEISNNHGIGIILNDTQLEIHGYNIIHENDGGLYMTSDSLLLMANGSVLNVSHNSAEFGGGIHISYKGRSIASYEDFLRCYVYKTTCPGWCFFQFIDQNGHLLMQNELNAYQTNINIEKNHASMDANEIYNGHLDNCSLLTKDGVVGASMETLLKVLPSRALEDKALDSLPHYICLCNTSNPQDYALWHCQQNFTFTVYPGDEPPDLVTILKDFNRSSFQTVFVKDRETGINIVTHSVCTKVYAMTYMKPGKQHSIQLYTTGPGQNADYSITTSITYYHLDCPLGMLNTTKGCICNSILAQHGFKCSGRWYKSVRLHNWIGMERGRLVIGDRCKFNLCNSSLLANGIPSDSVNLSSFTQCSSEYGREGLMCTQCPENRQPEYFSFKCRECPYEWIALLLILFIGGPLVVVILFLFNLTILQGTINGFILYSNMMIHTWSSSFFAHYTWKPLYIVFRYLSLSLGHGLCFFDEFSKALLHFAFPFYLLTLVATIIICAHKCNLRIFRVTFIARRAVPVLTTLMIMTFVNLSDAVLLALQYNHIYDASTGDRKVVFLFDSSLPYFRGKHLAVGLIAIICSVIYLLPLIVVTLFGDLLRRCTRSIWLSHFIDVFHGAYRYPFGFWLGARLLARVVLIGIALSVDNLFGRALSMFAAILCICLFQLYFKPFRTLEDHLATSQYSPSSCRKLSDHSRLEGILIKLQPSTLEFLYLLNALITTTAITYSSDAAADEVLLKIAANVSLTVALLQFLAILCYHTYRFLPLPKPVRMCLKSCSNHFTKAGRRKRQQTVCGITPTFDDTAAHAEPVMTIRLHPPQDGSHDNNYDSDESSSVSSDNYKEEKMTIDQNDAMTEATTISPGLTEPLLQSELTTSL